MHYKVSEVHFIIIILTCIQNITKISRNRGDGTSFLSKVWATRGKTTTE